MTVLLDNKEVTKLVWAAVQRVEVKQWDSHKLDLDHKLDLVNEIVPLVHALVSAVNPDASALVEELEKAYRDKIAAKAEADVLRETVRELSAVIGGLRG